MVSLYGLKGLGGEQGMVEATQVRRNSDSEGPCELQQVPPTQL